MSATSHPWATVGTTALALLSVGCTHSASDDTSGTGGAAGGEPRYLEYKDRRGDEAVALEYSQQMAVGAQSFDQWKASRCFDGEEEQLEYFNQADLSLGRHLHMTRCNDVIAAYVANYGNGKANQPAVDGLHALDSESHVAVAMDFNPQRDPGYEVQFYIYVGDQIATSIEFDLQGPKLAPYACTACHGGRLEQTPERLSVKDGFFLPVLAESLVFRELDFPEEYTMWKMNEIIRDTRPAPGIAQLLDAAYPKGLDTFQPYLSDQIPADWAAQSSADLYTKLIRPHCLPCHAAQLTHPFISPDQVQADVVRELVCVTQEMPNSQQARSHLGPDALQIACDGGIP